MTLLEYVQSLQEQGATDIPAKVQEWKKKNQPEVEKEVIETPVKEVKIDPAVETDAPATGTTNGASESSGFGDLGSSTASSDEYPINLPSIQGLSTKTGGFGTPEFYDEVFNNIALNEYEEKKEQYEKELKRNNKIKKKVLKTL